MSIPEAWRLPLIAGCLLLGGGVAAAEDRIVLRTNKLVARPVLGFDEDGVRLEGANPLGWDEIESARLDANQDRFDKFLKELGNPLFRIRVNLETGDYRRLAEHAEAIHGRYVKRRSQTAYLVFQALMWARLAQGQREAALEPYLLCLDTAKIHEKQSKTLVLPGTRKLPLDLVTGMTTDLAPVWFDGAAAKQALPAVRAILASLSSPAPPGAAIYAATLALAADDAKAADELLAKVDDSNRAVKELLQIVKVQREVVAGKPGPEVITLEAMLDQLLEAHRPLAYYWLGLAGLSQTDERKQKEGVLQLLRLPALYGDDTEEAKRAGRHHPDLAAAGLYHGLTTLERFKDPATSGLRYELLKRFPQTYHGGKLKAEMDARAKKKE